MRSGHHSVKFVVPTMDLVVAPPSRDVLAPAVAAGRGVRMMIMKLLTNKGKGADVARASSDQDEDSTTPSSSTRASQLPGVDEGDDEGDLAWYERYARLLSRSGGTSPYVESEIQNWLDPFFDRSRGSYRWAYHIFFAEHLHGAKETTRYLGKKSKEVNGLKLKLTDNKETTSTMLTVVTTYC